jgi:hypothetical protein
METGLDSQKIASSGSWYRPEGSVCGRFRNGETDATLRKRKGRRRRRTIDVYFGCLPTPESGMCSETGGKEEG